MMVYLQHWFLSGYFRVCQGTITSTLQGAYSHLWTKGKRVRFWNFQLQMFIIWQISLCYWWWYIVPHTLIVSLGINGINSRDYSHGLRFCWIKIVTGFNMYRVIRDTLSKVTFSKWGILSARISPQPARVCSLILGYCVSILYINTYCDSILPQ